MVNLQIKVRSPQNFRPIITVDGKRIKLVKNEYGSLVGSFSGEKENVNLKIYTLPHELESKGWFFLSLLYFIISILGIFDSRMGKKFFYLDYSCNVKLYKKTFIDVTLTKPEIKKTAFTINAGPFEQNETNVWHFSEKSPKRRKIMIATKCLIWLALVIGVITIVLV